MVNGLTLCRPDGAVLNRDFMEDDSWETVRKWRQWSYYKLKYQEFDR